MNIIAILFQSNAGHTKEYAELLSKELGVPACELFEAKKKFPKGSHIIFMGWLMAGNVKGYKKAAKRYDIQAVCGVGMAHSVSQIEEIRRINKLPPDLPVFYLQGGFELDKLHGIYKFMMKAMKSSALKKETHNEEETEMMELLCNGSNCVSVEHLAEIMDWLQK